MDEPYEVYKSTSGRKKAYAEWRVYIPLRGFLLIPATKGLQIYQSMDLKTAKEVYSKLADAIARMQEGKTNNLKKP